MRLTLLELVQTILSSMGSDEVNSISDTAESLQVANIVQQTYMNMIGRYDLPSHNQLFQLQPSNNPQAPVLMQFPEGVTRMDWIRYLDTNPADNSSFQIDQYGAYSQHDTNTDLQNNAGGWSTTSTSSVSLALGSKTFTVASGLNIKPGDSAFAIPTGIVAQFMSGTVLSYSGGTLVINITNVSGSGTYSVWNLSQVGGISGPVYKEVRMLPLEDFIILVNSMNPAEGNVGTFTFEDPFNSTGSPQAFQFYYTNDLQPQYCCILDNKYLIFDSYDNTQDSTLQGSKTMCQGWVYPPFIMQDNVYPPIEDQQVPLLLADAKALAFYELKRAPHQKAEEEVNKQVTSLMKFKAIHNKPSYYEELPNFGRSWSGRYWSGRL